MATFNQQGQNVHGNQYNAEEQNIQNTGKQGDSYDFSGATIDSRGGVFGVNSKQENIKIDITTNAPPTVADSQKAEFEALMEEFQTLLEQAKAEKPQETEAVVQLTQTLMTEAEKENPNSTMLQITGEGLKQAAQNLVDISDKIGIIAGKIVKGIVTGMVI